MVGKASRFSKEFLATVISLVSTAFGVVVALAWNTAIQQWFTQVFGNTGGEVAALFVYALIVTFLGVLVIVYLGAARDSDRRPAGRVQVSRNPEELRRGQEAKPKKRPYRPTGGQEAASVAASPESAPSRGEDLGPPSHASRTRKRLAARVSAPSGR